MKKIALFMLAVAIIFLNAGCQNTKSRAVEGAVIGGVVGATAGGIIGHQSHHGGQGAGIGAAAGALTGALIGSQMKKDGQSTQTPQASQAVNPNQMTLQQIVDLTNQGVNEAVIIDRIRMTNSKFALSADDISNLQQQGVSQNVINEIQQ
jgi:outer membrane lipoprotein SlyB